MQRLRGVPGEGDDGDPIKNPGTSYVWNSTKRPTAPLNDKETSLTRQKLNDWIPGWMLRCCYCKPCRLSRQERLFEKARDALDNEINIINVLKQIRHFEAFYRLSLQEKWISKEVAEHDKLRKVGLTSSSDDEDEVSDGDRLTAKANAEVNMRM